VSIICGGTSVSMTQQSYGAWVYSATLPTATSTSCSIQITDSNGQVLTSSAGVISSWSATSINFGTNFKNPVGTSTTASDTTGNTPQAPVVEITVPVVIGVVVLLLIALFLTLRKKDRRDSAIYHGESVAIPAQAPTESGAGTELVVATSTTPTTTTEAPRETFEESRQQLAEAVQLAAQSQEEQQPPSDWEQRKDENGATYYYNSKTGVSQWETPEPVAV